MRRLNDNLRGTLPMGRIVVQPLPDCENISLGLIDPEFPTGPLPTEVVRDVIADPAYWAFCWGSGLGLARLFHEHPEWVTGKSVLDLGAGSGVVGIAAARNEASRVVACDNDPLALAACRDNARLNAVELETVTDLAAAGNDIDLGVMADVLYDKSNLTLVDEVKARFDNVLIADSRIHELSDPDFQQVAEIEALTFPNLGEFDEFRTVRVFLYGTL